jgi:hypothetical protein
VTRRLLLGGLAAAPAWSAAGFRVSHPDGSIETVDPEQYRATVLLFLSNVCPISNDYQDRIRAMMAAFAGRGARFVLLNANDNEPAEETARYAADVRFAAPVYKDWRNKVADRFGATMTPEAVVLDAGGAVRYRGAIDDARNPARMRVAAVRTAVEDLLAGRAVSVKPIRAFGCAIKKVST